MGNQTEAGTQRFDSSSDTTDLIFGQESEMDPQRVETSADELTFRSAQERIKRAADLIVRGVEEVCTLLPGRTELDTHKKVKLGGPVLGVTLRALAPHVPGTTVGAI